ncbi:hypothetical protein Hoch_2904 [Haliangium ochraceum DSM 14365]|uniref:Uncharacterized protein n=1 Tax=Haliangium ochraceum (strain DSM 14365 / JCM 11303 / SMP-2) TaxID=502025 RepID=D0LPR1_HALO1|nr:hypothetical protein Hoch_2904 [Haliangium ochraceum DSM 14365]
MDDKRDENRGDDGGVNQGVDGGRAASIDFIEAMTGFIELVIEFDFPADAIDVGNLAGPEGTREIGEVEEIAFLLDENTAQTHRNGIGAHGDVGIDGVTQK